MKDVTENQINAIERYLHFTTEPLNDWDWNGEELLIFLNNKIIEKYIYDNLCEMIPDFEKL